MTKDEIIEMARQAGWPDWEIVGMKGELKAFAKLVAAKVVEREALKLARQLLWRYRHETPIGNQPHMICQEVDEAFERIDETLAQPAVPQGHKQEPVAWIYEFYADMGHKGLAFEEQRSAHNTPLYTTPPTQLHCSQRKPWVGLTDEEIMNMEAFYAPSFYDFYVAIEKKLKEKNT